MNHSPLEPKTTNPDTKSDARNADTSRPESSLTSGSMDPVSIDTVSTEHMCGRFVDVPSLCVHQRFEQQVERTPDATAVQIGTEWLTYRQLNEQANRLAHLLRGQGVGPDVLVGVSFERSLDLVVAIYAVLKAGGVYVPLDPSYPVERLQYMIGAANLRHLLTHQKHTDTFHSVSDVEVLLLDQLDSQLATLPTENPEININGDHRIYVIFTSGSTGQPKAAAVYHRGFANLVNWFNTEFAISALDRALLVSSLSFDLTQKNLFATLIAGGTLHLYPPGPYDISELSRLIESHAISLINCTPSAFYPLVEPFDSQVAERVQSLRVVFLGGEPISVSRIRPWLTDGTCRAEVANTYGPTECTDIGGFYRLTKDNLDQYDFVPLGFPVDNVQLAILNERNELCAYGEPGEICVGGSGVGAGYINDAEMTEAKFVDNFLSVVSSPKFYRTGDQGKWHSSGVVEFLGRLDHQVKIRGFRIELPEIEKTVELHDSINEAIVVVTQLLNEDPQLTCCFTTTHSHSVSPSELRSHLADHLPAHMIPQHFEVLESFPLSPNGKVDRNALAAKIRSENLHSDPAAQCMEGIENRIPAPPNNLTLEEKIAAAWNHLLNDSNLDSNDNFFDAGGDSLQLARLHQHLESLLDRKFPIIDLFAHPTVRGMAMHLAGDRKPEPNTRTLSSAGASQSSAAKTLSSQVSNNTVPTDAPQQPSPVVRGTPTSVRDRARLQREAMAARKRKRG